MSVASATLETEAGDPLSPAIQAQPTQHIKTPSQKLNRILKSHMLSLS